MHRRRFLSAAAAAPLAAALRPQAAVAEKLQLVKPRRLAPGDTVALVAPAGEIFRPSTSRLQRNRWKRSA